MKIRPVRTEVSVLALLGSLGLLAIPGPANAAFIPVPDTCGPQTGGLQDSRILDAVQDNGDGTFTYGYRACNTGGEGGDILVDWELPFFGTDLMTDNEAGITSISAPAGWAFSLEEIGTPNGLTNYGGEAEWIGTGEFDPVFDTVTHLLHFYCTDFGAEGCLERGRDGIFPGDSLDGFGFIADFDETDAPYQASWAALPPNTGDPADPFGGLPNSPSLQQQVPEPATLALFGAGLGMVLAGAKRRRREDSEDS